MSTLDPVTMCLEVNNRTFTDFQISVQDLLQQQCNDFVYHMAKQKGPQQDDASFNVFHEFAVSFVTLRGLNSIFTGTNLIWQNSKH